MSDFLTSGSNPAPSLPGNPFVSLVNSQSFHDLFTNAIDALLADGACATPCKLVFSGTKLLECNNCSGGIYTPGGPVPFSRGMVCPLCHGKTLEVNDVYNISLCVIQDSKQWLILSRPGFAQTQSSNIPNMYAETLCRVELYPKIKACDHAILNSDNANLTLNKYSRVGEPEFLGLGKMEYIITAWQRLE